MFVLVRFSSRDPLLCAHVLASVQGFSSIQLYSPVFVSHNLFVFLREILKPEEPSLSMCERNDAAS